MKKQNYSENKFSEFPNGSPTHNRPKYRLDTVTTKLWRTHDKPGHKVGSYVWCMSCYTARLKYVKMISEINEEEISRQNYSENKFSEFPNGSCTHDLPKYQLDVLLPLSNGGTHGEHRDICPAILQDSYISKWSN